MEIKGPERAHHVLWTFPNLPSFFLLVSLVPDLLLKMTKFRCELRREQSLRFSVTNCPWWTGRLRVVSLSVPCRLPTQSRIWVFEMLGRFFREKICSVNSNTALQILSRFPHTLSRKFITTHSAQSSSQMLVCIRHHTSNSTLPFNYFFLTLISSLIFRDRLD